MTASLVQPQTFEPREEFLGEIRQLVEVVDEVEGQAIETYGLQPGELLRALST